MPMQAVVKVGKRGTVVIPRQVRKEMQLSEGDVLLLEVKEGEIRLKPLKPRRVKLGGRVSQIVRQAKLEELELEK